MTTRTIEAWLIVLQSLHVIFLLLHDWVPLGRLTNLRAVRALDSTEKLAMTTLVSTLPFGFGLAFSLGQWSAPHWPMWLLTWLRVTYGLLIGGAALSWWIPYLSPSDSERAERYRVRFAGTLSFLPQRHGFAPDALHTIFHATLVMTVILLAIL